MRVLVLGSDGFLGKQLLCYFAQNGSFDVVGCTRRTSEEQYAGFQKVRADLTHFDAVCGLLRELHPDVVLNLAGATVGDARTLYLSNTVVPANVALAIAAHNSGCRLIHVGSAAEYGVSNLPQIDETAECYPVSLYGHSKLAATNLLMSERSQRGLQVIVLRPFNMVGEINSARQVLGAFVDKVLEQRRTGVLQPVRMGYLGAIRDFFCVEDLFLLILRLIEKPRAEFDIVNVCSGQGRSVRDVIRYLTDRIGSIEMEEDGGLVVPKAGDRIVGNPACFLAAAGLEHPTPLEPVLDRIWPMAGLQA